MKTDVAVIGGSAAGLTAAITARRHYPDKKILLIRKEEKVLIPCGIPYIFGTVGSVEKNLIPDAILEKNNIELLITEVPEISPSRKSISIKDGYEIEYDKMVLASGSVPSVPPIPGAGLEGVFAIYKDTNLLMSLQQSLSSARNLVVIGGGFIGVEFADECNKSGSINATVAEILPHCLALAYDEEFCVAAEELLGQRGIGILTSKKVSALTGNGKVQEVLFDDGQSIPADVVILSTGAKANVELAKEAGFDIGPTGGVSVDNTMKTSDENVFACGDCAEKVSFFDEKPTTLKLASIATYEARIAGANLFEKRRSNVGTVGVWSTAIGDTALAVAGLTEEMAKGQGYSYVVGSAEAPNRHPGGMPGTANLKLKLVFEKRTGVLLGGQVMGDKAAGEVVNMISACVQQRVTAENIALFQAGTHPALTASPIAYQVVNAAEAAVSKLK